MVWLTNGYVVYNFISSWFQYRAFLLFMSYFVIDFISETFLLIEVKEILFQDNEPETHNEFGTLNCWMQNFKFYLYSNMKPAKLMLLVARFEFSWNRSFSKLWFYVVAYMFTNNQRQEERIGKYGTPRVQYLQVCLCCLSIPHDILAVPFLVEP